MNYSFYSGAVGASAQQQRLDIIANNISNINTTGFKSKQGVFNNLIYSSMNALEGENSSLKAGAGAKLDKTDTDFEQGVLAMTGYPLDYAINGQGFFALYDPLSQETTYTRSGSFSLSEQPNGEIYITSSSGKWVLDPQGEPIIIEDPNEIDELHNIGVYIFEQKNGMINTGFSEFLPVEKNGEPISVDGQGILVQGFLENSNVGFEKETIHMLESQRVYQLSIQLVRAADEIENTINSLR